MTRNPIAQKRSRHINIDIHFVRKLVCNGVLKIQHVPSNLQIADIFTKSPSKSLFMLFRSKLHVLPTTLDLRGSIGVNTNSSPTNNPGENPSKH
jgi:hypothetical protein